MKPINRAALQLLFVLSLSSLVWGQDSLNVSCDACYPINWSNAAQVEIAGDYVFVADMGIGVRVIDVSNPNSVVEVGCIDIDGTAMDIAIAGDFLYIADNSMGLRVIDISDPLSCIERSSLISADEHPLGIAAAGDYVYLADARAGMGVIDVSDPDNPAITGYYVAEDYCNNVAVAGDYAYLLEVDAGLRILDISNPANPVLTALHPFSGYMRELTFDDGFVYVAGYEGGLGIIDVSDPHNPALVTYLDYGSSSDVKIADNKLYCCQNSEGLYIFDVTDPAQPVLEGVLDTPGYVRGVAVDGGYAYIGDWSSGFAVADVSQPSDPVEVFRYFRHGYAVGIAVLDDHYYLTGQDVETLIFDTDNFSNPFEIGKITGVYGNAIDISGETIFVLENGLICVLDGSDPANPVQIGSCQLEYIFADYVREIIAEGDFVYSLQTESGLTITDISNLINPVPAGSFDTLGDAEGMCLENEIIYIACGNAGMVAVDVRDPYDPIEIGTINPGGIAKDIAVSGNYAYLACYTSGIKVVNIANPDSFFVVSAYVPGGRIESVELIGNQLAAAGLNNGIKTLDICDPGNLVETGYYDTPAKGFDLSSAGEKVYLAGGYYYGVFDVSVALPVIQPPESVLPLTTMLLPNYPNPFNAATTLTFNLSSSGKVSLKVFDITGREAASLVHGHLSLGQHSVVWNAEGFASAVYLVRIQQQSAGTLLHETRQVVLVK